ncbi:MAG: galactose oxidase-like domain-containing protein [Gemmataceae bacterium]
MLCRVSAIGPAPKRIRSGQPRPPWPALVLVCCLALAPPAPAQDTAPARAPVSGVHALSAKDYLAWIARMKKEGFRPTHVSAYGVGVKQFAAVAVKDGKDYPWEARIGLTEPQYRKACDDLYKTGGYRVVSVSCYYEGTGNRFAALWVKDGRDWQARHGMTSAAYKKTCDDLRPKGYRVISVTGYSEGKDDTHFAAVWVADKSTTWLERHDLTEPEYRHAYDELRPKGYRPVSISHYYLRGSPRYAVVFAQGSKDYWEARHNLTREEYQWEFERWTSQGGRPLLVIGCTYPKTTTYAAVFVGDEATHKALVGEWSPVLDKKNSGWTVVAIHAAMLHTGKVLVWPRIQLDGEVTKENPKPHSKTPLRPKAEGYPHLWDPAHPMDKMVETAGPPYNIFCSGHAFLPDGRLFVAGGHMWANFWGDGRVTIYDPAKNTWTSGLPAMNLPRWYPSCVTLASGDILVEGGTYYSDPVKVNRLPQVWLTRGDLKKPWRDLTNIPDDDIAPGIVPFYPFLHVAPNGKVFRAGPNTKTGYMDTAGAGKWEPVGDRTFERDRDYGSSVMYQQGKVLAVGGGFPPTASAEVIDLNNTRPVWQHPADVVSPPAHERHHSGRRHVFVSGGAEQRNFMIKDTKTGKVSGPSLNDATAAVLNTELWNPHTERWIPMAAQSVPRLYHSTALLLPDGKVLSAGGGEPGGDTAKGFGPSYPNAQIFSPPYLFRGPRPVVTSAPAAVKYGQQFEVKTPDAAHIRRSDGVTWIRLGSATHARNFDQRLVYPAYYPTAGSVFVTAPPSPSMAPPGHYMLFILNDKGVPSMAKIIQIG